MRWTPSNCPQNAAWKTKSQGRWGMKPSRAPVRIAEWACTSLIRKIENKRLGLLTPEKTLSTTVAVPLSSRPLLVTMTMTLFRRPENLVYLLARECNIRCRGAREILFRTLKHNCWWASGKWIDAACRVAMTMTLCRSPEIRAILAWECNIHCRGAREMLFRTLKHDCWWASGKWIKDRIVE